MRIAIFISSARDGTVKTLMSVMIAAVITIPSSNAPIVSNTSVRSVQIHLDVKGRNVKRYVVTTAIVNLQ